MLPIYFRIQNADDDPDIHTTRRTRDTLQLSPTPVGLSPGVFQNGPCPLYCGDRRKSESLWKAAEYPVKTNMKWGSTLLRYSTNFTM